MNKIIPFSKEIVFNEQIGEIESIALDDTLKFIDKFSIKGELIVRGCHKYQEIEHDFSYPIPVEINVDTKYNTQNANIEIDDFYYEIINDNILKVKIDLLLDHLEYQIEDITPVNETIDERNEMEENKLLPPKDEEINNIEGDKKIDDNKDNVINLFKPTDEEKEYSIYRVYTIMDNDTIDSIIKKYGVAKEEMEKYNDLSSFKTGDKLIIPSLDE